MNRGVLTIASGPEVYISHAKNLARSFRIRNKDLPIALVTDSKDPQLSKLFNQVIPLRTDWGTPFRQKLSVDLYSPFDETIFVDSDCLIVRDVSRLWPMLENTDFAIHGELIHEGRWGKYAEIPPLLAKLGVPWLPKFNSGLFLFRQGKTLTQLMEGARDVHEHFEEYHLTATHSGLCGDEPALSISMARLGIKPIPDTGIGQGGTFDYVIPCMNYKINLLDGTCRYTEKGRVAEPTVAHFLAHGWRRPKYRREVLKLDLIDSGYPRLAVQIIGDIYGEWLRFREAASRLKKRLLHAPKTP